MYRMSVLAMALANELDVDVDVNKCVRMALIHDIGEAIIGDITPRCGIGSKEKFQLEEKVSNFTPFP